MIPRVNERTNLPYDPLGEALGRSVPIEGGLPEDAVVAYWPGLDSYVPRDELAAWTATQWAEHLGNPRLEHPFIASPKNDRRAIVHLHVRLHPDDRDLSGAEWAEAAHRLARAAGIETPGDKTGCHWIAVQGKPGRLDLIANLIRLDGSWQQQPADHLRRLSDEARRIEEDLRLTPVPVPSGQRADAPAAPTASTQFATVLAQIADKQSGTLTAVRGLLNDTAHQISWLPAGAAPPGMAARLELIARCLGGIQLDLGIEAKRLSAPARPRVAAPPAAQRSAHRSP